MLSCHYQTTQSQLSLVRLQFSLKPVDTTITMALQTQALCYNYHMVKRISVLNILFVSVLIGIVLSLLSQFIWQSQSPTSQSVNNQICAGAADAASSGSIQSCGSPEPPVTTTKGFPFGYSKKISVTTYAACDGACAQTTSSTTRTTQFSIVNFVWSSLTWSVIVCVLLIVAGLLRKKVFHRV